MKRAILLGTVALVTCLVAGAGTVADAAAPGRLVVAITLNSEINPVSASFVKDSIDRAKSEHAAALVVLMDTPGGLSTSMDDIIQAELASPVPVIVYVSPAGARAASAGAFIMMGADVAAMTPASNIGSASPIDSSGQDIGGTLGKKVLNDAEKKIQALAQTHGRNPGEAVAMVSSAANYTAAEALSSNLIDYVSPSLPALLNQIDGTTTFYSQKHIVLHTAGARIESFGMPWTLQLLNILIDPNLLYLLFLAGIGGLAYEVFHPGVILPGTLGAVSLILALFGFSVVPINLAGALLIAIGVLMVVLEAFVTSHGLIAISGIVALVVGGLLLFRTPGSGISTSPVLVIGIGVVFGVGLAVIATKVVEARHQPVSVFGAGAAGLLGQIAVTRTPLSPDGQVFVHGELWRARSAADVPAGHRVVIDQVEGLTLHVSPDDDTSSQGAPE